MFLNKKGLKNFISTKKKLILTDKKIQFQTIKIKNYGNVRLWCWWKRG